MLFLRFVILIYFVGLNFCYAEENIDEKTILVLGDSLSAAHGIKLENGWVNLLQQRLKEKYGKHNKWNIINASVSGETTAGGLARLPKLIEIYQPVLCIIELGANNGLRGQSTELMKQHLDKMLQICNNSGTSLLLGVKLPPNYGQKFTQAFENVYFELAELHNIPLVPFILDGIALRNELMQNDGLHPTAEAQLVILENIWPTLNKTIDSIN